MVGVVGMLAGNFGFGVGTMDVTRSPRDLDSRVGKERLYAWQQWGLC